MSDRVVAARRFVDELVRAEHLEVRRAATLATDLAAMIDALGRAPTGTELEDWLGEHRQVEELYASAAALETIGDRHFRPPPVRQDAHNPELEAQLRDTLEPGPYLVYADWLQERGDLFGELIALGVAATAGGPEDKKRFTQFLDTHERLFLRGIRNTLGSFVRLDWHNGFITSVEESERLGAGRWKRLFDLRVAPLIRTIALCDPDAEVDALIAEHAPALRDLHLRLGRLPVKILAGERLRSVAIVSKDLVLEASTLPPQLDKLELTVHELERSPALARLDIRELVLKSSWWEATTSAWQSLRDLELPHLEHLALYGIDGTVADTCAILDAIRMPALRRLTIAHHRLRAADVRRLVALDVAPQLTALALVNARLADDMVAELAPLHGSLVELDVSENELTPAGVERARALAATVVAGDQHEVGSEAMQQIRAFAAGRYAAAEEIADPDRWRDAGRSGAIRWARYTAGSEPYELYVTADLARYGCSCPSRYQPCKHVVALAAVAVRVELPELPSGDIEQRVGRFRFEVV
jgi:uncharacterized protein (TIGR02996 family)